MRVGSRRVGLCVCVSFLLFWYFSSPSSPPPNSYYLNAAHPDSGYLSHVIEITGDLGLYRESSLNSEWSLLWSHTYPFSNKTRLGAQLKELEWGRRVNKIPGGGWLSSKQALAQIKSPFIPRAFTLPAHLEQFLAVRETSDWWLVKSGQHRHIKVVREEDLANLGDKKERFVQEMVQPLIISGRKFDIGTYVVVTSAEPLRVYVLDEWLLRFCNRDYHPFDPAETKQYVVGDDYTPIWEVDQIKDIYSRGVGMKKSLFGWLDQNGFDSKKLETTMQQAIAEIWQSQQSKLAKATEKYNNYPGQFFELLRMDWVLNEKAEPLLLEVNMSPNLSSGHFKQNAQLYRYVLTSLFHLVGLVSPPRLFEWEVTICPVGLPIDCARTEFKFCRQCLSDDELAQLNQITVEQKNTNFVRVTPKGDHHFEGETGLGRFQRAYFNLRCTTNSVWC